MLNLAVYIITAGLQTVKFTVPRKHYCKDQKQITSQKPVFSRYRVLQKRDSTFRPMLVNLISDFYPNITHILYFMLTM